MVETEDERGRKVKRSRANKKGEKIQTESNATDQTFRSQTRTERKTEKNCRRKREKEERCRRERKTKERFGRKSSA